MEEIVKQLAVMMQNAYTRMWVADMITKEEHQLYIDSLNQMIKRLEKIRSNQSE